MKQSRCVQSSREKDFIYRLQDCEIFPKLDLRQGHHQLALDPSKGQVAAFSTPWRNYRSQRLMFGAKSPQDVFHEARFSIFGDTHHCVKPKRRHTLKNEGLRASIDMRIPNQSMKQSRCVQSSREKDFIYRLHDCEIFTKLDLRQGHHQLALDPSKGQVAVFSTPWRNCRSQRLMFGAKSPQDVFHEARFSIFGDTHHCVKPKRRHTPRGNGPDRT